MKKEILTYKVNIFQNLHIYFGRYWNISYICEVKLKTMNKNIEKDSKFLEILYAEYNELLQKIKSVESTISTYGGSIINKIPQTELINNTIDIQAQYDQGSTWAQKILFILKEIESGYTSDIAKKMTELEPDISYEKAKGIATSYCSKLYVDKKISAKKIGKKNKYMIK